MAQKMKQNRIPGGSLWFPSCPMRLLLVAALLIGELWALPLSVENNSVQNSIEL